MNNTISDNAAEIDSGIRDAIKGMRLSILAIGIGLAKIKMNHLHKELGTGSFAKYIRRLHEEAKMDRSSIYRWLNVGLAWFKYQTELEKTGFNDSDGPTKLTYLEQALKNHDKQEVFNNIKTMSVREFAAYSRAGIAKNADDRLTIKINRKLDRETCIYFRKVVHTACQALEKNEVVLPLRLASLNEARRFARPINQFVLKLRQPPRRETG